MFPFRFAASLRAYVSRYNALMVLRQEKKQGLCRFFLVCYFCNNALNEFKGLGVFKNGNETEQEWQAIREACWQ